MDAPEPIVYVVDDDQAVRESLASLVSSVDLPVKTFDSGTEFLDDYRADSVGCLVADVRMPGMSGLDLQKELVARAIELPLIMITGHGDVKMCARAMKAGAFDFIEKPFNSQELLDLIHRAIDKSLEEATLKVEITRFQKRLGKMKPRDREVLEGIVAGETNKKIAAKLGISEKTVEFRRARVMKIMQAGSLAELVKMVMMAEPLSASK